MIQDFIVIFLEVHIAEIFLYPLVLGRFFNVAFGEKYFFEEMGGVIKIENDNSTFKCKWIMQSLFWVNEIFCSITGINIEFYVDLTF